MTRRERGAGSDEEARMERHANGDQAKVWHHGEAGVNRRNEVQEREASRRRREKTEAPQDKEYREYKEYRRSTGFGVNRNKPKKAYQLIAVPSTSDTQRTVLITSNPRDSRKSCAPCRMRCFLDAWLGTNFVSSSQAADGNELLCHTCKHVNDRKQSISSSQCNHTHHLTCIGIMQAQATQLIPNKDTYQIVAARLPQTPLTHSLRPSRRYQ
ncbi:hypothetical protein O3P69_009983 [Scylla paramamosain]|uniref:Uncharacterized protein n=1 Tax=Scylla paramamosain TaxID=85552 RepID=A0AAW0SP31_SCYPA